MPEATALRRLVPGALLLGALILAGCTDDMPTDPDRQDVLVMGDSILAWNAPTGRSVAAQLQRLTGHEIVDRSVIGSRMLPSFSPIGLLAGPIGTQYVAGDWDWIVLNGGGNDLWWGCGCSDCEDRLDRMIAEDGGSGAIPALVSRLRQSGARIVYVGYLRLPGRDGPISHCREIGDRFEARIARMAARMPGASFLSNADVVPHRDLSFHDIDRIHPSAKGSAIIAARLARILRTEDG